MERLWDKIAVLHLTDLAWGFLPVR